MTDGVSASSPVNLGRFATTAANRIRILERYKRIAVVGLSSNPFRPSHFAAIYLLAHGYDVTPVNPREKVSPEPEVLSVALGGAGPDRDRRHFPRDCRGS